MECVQLRKGNAEQEQLLERLLAPYMEELWAHGSSLPRTVTAADWARGMLNMQGDADRHLEAVYDGGEPVGFLYGKVDREGHRGYIRPGWGYIMEFYVTPDHRRRGLGRAMFRRLEGAFARDGALRMYLTADPVTGAPFWTAMGFTATAAVSPDNGMSIWEKAVGVDCRLLRESDLHPDMLQDFDRRQEGTALYRPCGDTYTREETRYVFDWHAARKREVAAALRESAASGGCVYAACDGAKLAGFGSVSPRRWGGAAQYVQLGCMHVDRAYRGRGIGRRLFTLCAAAARELGARKLYISAAIGAETVAFYRAMGCVYAAEFIPALRAAEPEDVHMEYALEEG